MAPVFLLLAGTFFLLHLFAAAAAGQGEVIDLQDLLKSVVGTLQELKNGGACKEQEDVEHALDCAELFRSGRRASGIYTIKPLSYKQPIKVYCDMMTNGGGWTVFQRRGDFGNPVDYFYKTWREYKKGFGDLRKEFWLGNDNIAAVSQQRTYQLRIDLWTVDRNTSYASFDKFGVGYEQDNYTLHVAGYSGTAGDALSGFHNGQQFSTKDRGVTSGCAQRFQGAWWYKNCHNSNLNGLNLKGITENYAVGIIWNAFKGQYYSLYSEMKVRPLSFSP